MNSYLTRDELMAVGFKSIGEDVLISRKASLYSPGQMSFGNHVRIDDFCFLSGKVEMADYVHVASSCLIYGGSAGARFEDFSGLSPRVTLICDSDDYSGEYMTNPTVPEKYLNCTEKEIVLKKHVIIGTGTTVLPGIILGEGCSVGAMSLVTKSTTPWTINVGVPAKPVKERKKSLLEMEKQLRIEESVS